uniref:FAR1 domain-containing protein n=1 Tax=Oryza punctata TaxID=4537 RepID=A0A0E0MEX6_ORYPU
MTTTLDECHHVWMTLTWPHPLRLECTLSTYDDAYNFYKRYAYHAGFDVKKIRTQKAFRGCVVLWRGSTCRRSRIVIEN